LCPSTRCETHAVDAAIASTDVMEQLLADLGYA